MRIRREQPGLELIDLLDRILDKGVTVEASARIRVSANDFRKMRAHIVVESVEMCTGRQAQSELLVNVGRRPRWFCRPIGDDDS